jgi:hypothetical protein
MKRGLWVLSVFVCLFVTTRVRAVTVFTVEGDSTKMIITTASCQELKDAGVKVDRCVQTPRANTGGGYDGYWPDAKRSADLGFPVFASNQGGFSTGVHYGQENVSDWKLDATTIDAEYLWGDAVAPYVRGGVGRADIDVGRSFIGRSFQGEGTLFTAGAGLRFRRDVSPWSAFADYRYRTLSDADTFKPNVDAETTIDHDSHELTAGVRYAILANRLAAIAGVRGTRAEARLDTMFGAYNVSTDVDLDRTELVAGAELQITQPLSGRFEVATGDGNTQGAVSLTYRFGRRLPPGPTTPQNTTIEGTITAPDGKPVPGVIVTTGSSSSQSGRSGRFSISAPRQARTAISFTHPDYVKTTRVIDTRNAASITDVIVIWPRAAAVTIDGAAGGLVPFAAGGGVRIPPNSLVTASGRPVDGKASIRLTLLDVSDRAQLRSVPGDFTARLRDGRTTPLESFGVFEIVGTSNGEAIDFRPGTRAPIEVPVPERIRPRATPRTTTFSFEPASGLWIEEGDAVLSGSTYNGWITRFDWDWNLDNPLDTTCIHAQVIRVYPTTGPVAGALVTATGVSYAGTSSATTDAQGYACLLVKINSVVDLEAVVSSVSLGIQQVTTPNVVAGAAQCTTFGLCPLMGVPFEKDW